jgi:tRNA 2-selenouridine synthase
MSVRRITPADALLRLAEFDTLIDARSESEFAEDHLPGAVNWPSLNDEERHAVGTEYQQVSPFAARKRGAALVARNIARHIETQALHLPREWKPLVYCWRGGQRSGALSLVLDQIGFTVHALEGGYVGFRRAVVAALQARPQALQWRVLCGRTGSAKSRLLQALRAEGAQVLDLEALACHRGSVLGPLPEQPQPSQKAFETQIWWALRGMDPDRPVFAECESRTIGRLRVPESLLECLRAASCVRVEMPLDARVAFLIEDYDHLVQDSEGLCQTLLSLRELRGGQTVERWQGLARSGDFPALVHELLSQHYDPGYMKSIQRNFAGFESASALELPDAGALTLVRAARALLEPTLVVGDR